MYLYINVHLFKFFIRMRKSLLLMCAATAIAGLSFQARADLYIIGAVEGAGWSANLGVPMTATATANEYEITIQVEGTFGFATQLGANADDWDGLNANRYGAEYDPYPLSLDVETAMYKNTCAFSLNPGEYHIVANLDAMTVTASSTTPVEQPKTMYICGALDGHTWNPTDGVAMTAGEDEGVFTATVNVTGGAGDGVDSFGFVGFTSQLSADENDWTTFNANRFGPSAYNQAVAPGTEYVMQRNENSFGLPGGEYDVTVNLNDNTATFTPTGTINYNYPDTIYLIGNVNGSSEWLPTNGIKIAESESTPGEYKGNITITDGTDGYFGIGTLLTEDAEGQSWNTFNAARYIPAGNDALTLGEAAELKMTGDASFTITPGNYDLTIKLTSIASGTITLSTPGTSSINGVDADGATYPVTGDGTITIVGEADTVEVYTVGGALVAADAEAVTCPAGVYVVVIDGTAHKVIVK